MEAVIPPMKTNQLSPRLMVVAALLALAGTGCNRQSRGNADASNDNVRAASPAEGGATSTAGSAGDPKNFGDTRQKAQVDGQSPSASPTGLSQDASAQHNVQTSGAGASTGQQTQQAKSREDQPK